jgi:ribose/xylose/arabinose/galactoside ABC-type transport system permease subunit
MVSGHIDLSIGSAMSLCEVVYALLAMNGVPFPVAFAVVAAVGVGLGAINGLLG